MGKKYQRFKENKDMKNRFKPKKSMMMRRTNKGLDKFFNRCTLLTFAILIQLGVLVWVVLGIGDYARWINLLFVVASVVMSIFIIYRNDNPAYKMGWILLICLFPIMGVVMYLLFGNKRPARHLRRKFQTVETKYVKLLSDEGVDYSKISTRTHKTLDLISKVGGYPPCNNNDVTYYPEAKQAFEDMLKDLENAKEFIFLEYFIIDTGYMWGSIEAILSQKVKEGVDVRLIYDDVGSINKVNINFASQLEASGIKVLAFNPLKPILSMVYNNRDHRKICVIDGEVAYTGGFNLADEYINKINPLGHWKDTGLKIVGNGVYNYTVMFLNMWNAFRKSDVDYLKFKREFSKSEGKGIIQPYSDSPLNDERLGEDVYLELINQSTDYVYIFTPYLILDNEMITALQIAAKRGVDVRIVTPANPDKKLVFRLTRSYYKPLLKWGVKLYEYTPGFIHAKSMISDDKIGIVGTINLDYRSLFLHFECATLMVEIDAVKDLKNDALETFDVSKEIFLSNCRKGILGAMIDGILRVLSPLI